MSADEKSDDNRTLMALDPGPVVTGCAMLSLERAEPCTADAGRCTCTHVKVAGAATWDNTELESMLESDDNGFYDSFVDGIAVEYPKPMGMPASQDLFDTLFAIGRFSKCSSVPMTKIGRQEVKLFLCGRATAKDKNIRQAVIDSFGGDTKARTGLRCERCKGRGLCERGRERGECAECGGSGWRIPRGPLYRVKGHEWAALGVGLTAVHKIANGTVEWMQHETTTHSSSN